MAKYRLDYIWLDGYSPVQNLRTKCMLKDFDEFPSVDQLPEWGFDGSSTKQADGGDSDCVLKPVACYPDGTRENGVLVMCEVMLPDGAPHPTNGRASIPDDPGTWFGFEQEYFLEKEGEIYGFPKGGFPEPQGEYYCGVGTKNVGDARAIVDEHLDLCLYAGINHEEAADDIWVARFLLLRLCEEYGLDVNWHCKPLGATDWNGSGMHANFSTEYLRETGGKEYFEKLMGAFEEFTEEHIAVYGPDNDQRLTGLHETQSIDKFSWGIADRGASIRVPHSFAKNDWKGYLEDRRPNSQGDPYKIAGRILQTIQSVPT